MSPAILPRLVTLVAASTVALGCGAYSTTSKPAMADLVGRWRIRPSSAADLKRLYPPLDAPAASIELAADGTIAFAGVPSILVDEMDPTQRRLVDRKGTWTLEQSGGAWHVATSIPNDRGGFRGAVSVWNEKRPYWLSLNCDDPDLWNFIFFDRDGDAPDTQQPSGK